VKVPLIKLKTKNKKPEVELIIESCKPSIIFGTETWLSNDISPYEYIPSSKYNIRKDGYGSMREGRLRQPICPFSSFVHDTGTWGQHLSFLFKATPWILSLF
jgi:hypothetical protein